MKEQMIRKIGRADVEAVLVAMETGNVTVEDANLLRAYLRMLENMVKALEKRGGEDGRN
jgi:hypothetical protein